MRMTQKRNRHAWFHRKRLSAINYLTVAFSPPVLTILHSLFRIMVQKVNEKQKHNFLSYQDHVLTYEKTLAIDLFLREIAI